VWRVGVALALYAAALALSSWGYLLYLGPRIALWALLAAAAVYAGRRVLPDLLSPVLFFDLVRSARRGSNTLARVGYILFLMLALFWVYASWFPEGLDWELLWESRRIDARSMASFAESFNASFLALQFVVTLFLTPLYFAGAVAEEKERRTLEYLLTTHLSDAEIVLSKYLSRLAHLWLVLLAGLPVLALLQFLGGVDPALVSAAFALTALTTLSLGAFATLQSVLRARPLSAALRTYAEALLVLGCCGFVPGLRAGNPFWVLLRWEWEFARGGAGWGPLLVDYALTHLLLTALCLGWAVSRLRRRALPGVSQAWVASRPHPSFASPCPGRPRVTNSPLVWKEMYGPQELTVLLDARAGILLVLVLLTTGLVAAGTFLVAVGGPPEKAMSRVNLWVIGVSLPVFVLAFPVVAFAAATAIARERERRTLDSLLTIPAEAGEILAAKWLGVILSVRWAWWALAAVGTAGVLTGGLHPVAVPLWALAWCAFAALAASVGLYFSALCPTTLRATLFTGMALAAWGAGTWMLLGEVDGLVLYRLPQGYFDWLPPLARYGLAPPMPLVTLAFPLDFGADNHAGRDAILGALGGVAFYAALAGLLWWAALQRFNRETHRSFGKPKTPPFAPPPEAP
jgi:ABC-type transport system involved in multi-copper enzyme maturation permease subunit